MKITGSVLSALKQLYRLEIKKKLSKVENADLVGIRASVAPLNTSNLTDEQRQEIRNELNNKLFK
jgi:hypothetical protein